MQKFIVMLVSVLIVSVTAFAQDVKSELTGQIFDCNKINEILDIAKTGTDEEIARFYDQRITIGSTSDALTLAEFIAQVSIEAYSNNDSDQTIYSVFEDMERCAEDGATATPTVSDFESFNIVANNGVNIRSCAATTCSVVRLTNDREVFKVTGEDNGWYMVRLAGGQSGFISQTLTTRGPDAVINSLDNWFHDSVTGCSLSARVKRGDKALYFILQGKKQFDITIDIIRPNDSNPLRVEAQEEQVFIDSADTYVLQYYSYGVSWPKGVYTFILSYNGKTSRLAWDMKVDANYRIFVDCD